MNYLKKQLLTLLFYLPLMANAQLIVDTSGVNNDPAYLVNNVLVSSGVTVYNITFNGSSGNLDTINGMMIGHFNGDSSNIGLSSGVLLSSGDVTNAMGPNDDEGFLSLFQPYGILGDSDLTLLSGVPSLNAAKLEFDFETVNDTVSFRYVFASEEYPEYACGTFNDAFGFFISGPGISGPFSNGAENIALIPGTTTLVAINTVNIGTAGVFGDTLNCDSIDTNWINYSSYYVDNGDGSNPLIDSTVQYDGFTTVLTAEIVLIPCQTYHIKLVVADAMDESYDSGVFLEAGSFGAAVGIPFGITVDSIKDVTCAGGNDGAIYGTTTGGNPPYTYFWSNGDTTEDISNLSSGAYFIGVMDADGCVFTDSITVNEPNFSLTLSSVDAICGNNDGLASGIVSGGNAPYTYLWDDPGAQTNDTAFSLSAGTYVLAVTDANSCTISGTIGVNNTGGPSIVTDTIANALCNADSNGFAIVSATGGTLPYSYLWDDLNAQTNATATGLSAGTYSLILTDSNNCIATAVVVITEPNNMILSIGKTDPSCSGLCDGTGFVVVSGGTTPYSFIWDDSLSQTNANPINLCEGSYNVIVTDINGCADSASISLTDPLGMNLTFDSIVDSCSDLTGLISVAVSNGNAPYTYLWDDPGTQTNDTASGLGSGTYSVMVTDNFGCQMSGSASISSPDSLYVLINSTNVSCFGANDGTATANTLGGFPPYSYLWSNSAISSSISGLANGVFLVTITDNAGCMSIKDITINEPDSLWLSSTINNISCYGGSDGAIDLNVSGGSSPFTYDWLNTSDSTQDISGLLPGSYMVIVTDSNNCMDSTIVILTEPSAIQVALTYAAPTCYGYCDGMVIKNIYGGSPPYGYTWNPPISDTANVCAGSYSLTITDNNSCITSDSIILYDPPELLVTGVSDSANANMSDGSIDITVSGGAAPYVYAWSNSTTTEDQNNLLAGFYTVIVTDSMGCIDSLTIEVPEKSGVGLMEPDKTAFVSIFPNPTTGVFTLAVTLKQPETIEISLYQIDGKLVKEKKHEAKKGTFITNYSINNKERGIYILQITTNTQTINRKVVLQ